MLDFDFLFHRNLVQRNSKIILPMVSDISSIASRASRKLEILIVYYKLNGKCFENKKHGISHTAKVPVI